MPGAPLRAFHSANAPEVLMSSLQTWTAAFTLLVSSAVIADWLMTEPVMPADLMALDIIECQYIHHVGNDMVMCEVDD